MASILCVMSVVNLCFAPELMQTVVAIAQVESDCDPSAVGDGGSAVGVLQIRPIMVRDCNRILGREEFTLVDRLDVTRSVQMFFVFSLHYHPQGTPEQWARAWNGGPDGPEQVQTAGYWRKVQNVLAMPSRGR